MGDTGKGTGFYLSEGAHPYEVFSENDYQIILTSPQGVLAPIDPKGMDLNNPANNPAEPLIAALKKSAN